MSEVDEVSNKSTKKTIKKAAKKAAAKHAKKAVKKALKKALKKRAVKHAHLPKKKLPTCSSIFIERCKRAGERRCRAMRKHNEAQCRKIKCPEKKMKCIKAAYRRMLGCNRMVSRTCYKKFRNA